MGCRALALCADGCSWAAFGLKALCINVLCRAAVPHQPSSCPGTGVQICANSLLSQAANVDTAKMTCAAASVITLCSCALVSNELQRVNCHGNGLVQTRQPCARSPASQHAGHHGCYAVLLVSVWADCALCWRHVSL